jgi:hypothetical protein
MRFTQRAPALLALVVEPPPRDMTEQELIALRRLAAGQ